ncbi:MAG: isoprenylcysteine carboxylmethyltransferase family protein [Candidatus Beckwithbacteria bacterium]|nr:isoprenylcysteine carboxylmethyltransferase family protein [Candidatus Beckwithbacteria bacterium]
MKLKTILLALFSGSCIWIIFPYLVIKLNQYFGLPAWQFWPLQIGGVFLIICGITIYAHLTLMFKIFGEGTPMPTEPPQKFVLASLYQRTRNPMYLCHLIIFLGEFLVFGSVLLLVYLVLFWVKVNLIVVLWEEPGLTKRFGKEYLDYCQKVPRWF